MAKRIEGPYDFSKHGFQAYADGATWELTHGEDFQIQPQSLAAAARQWGRETGLGVETKVTIGEPSKVALRFTEAARLRAVNE